MTFLFCVDLSLFSNIFLNKLMIGYLNRALFLTSERESTKIFFSLIYAKVFHKIFLIPGDFCFYMQFRDL